MLLLGEETLCCASGTAHSTSQTALHTAGCVCMLLSHVVYGFVPAPARKKKKKRSIFTSLGCTSYACLSLRKWAVSAAAVTHGPGPGAGGGDCTIWGCVQLLPHSMCGRAALTAPGTAEISVPSNTRALSPISLEWEQEWSCYCGGYILSKCWG